MSHFERALATVLRNEGGWVDDPADPGGETNYGITRRTYDRWRAGQGLPPAPVRDIPMADVAEIYRVWYWEKARCDRMPWPLSLIHFDCFVNCRPTDATKQLQRALGVTDDGIFGPITLGRAVPAGPRESYRYLLERTFFYHGLARSNPVWVKFLAGGWLARLMPLYREIT